LASTSALDTGKTATAQALVTGKALGLEFTIFTPAPDPDGSRHVLPQADQDAADRIAALIER
jgi:hypothetical protein